jgi:hypothetical protein
MSHTPGGDSGHFQTPTRVSRPKTRFPCRSPDKQMPPSREDREEKILNKCLSSRPSRLRGKSSAERGCPESADLGKMMS